MGRQVTAQAATVELRSGKCGILGYGVGLGNVLFLPGRTRVRYARAA